MNLEEQKEKQARCEKCGGYEPHEEDYTNGHPYDGECVVTEDEVKKDECCKGWGPR